MTFLLYRKDRVTLKYESDDSYRAKTLREDAHNARMVDVTA